MPREVTVKLEVMLRLTLPDGVAVDDVVSEMDYGFTPPDGVILWDEEIVDSVTVSSCPTPNNPT